MTRDDHGLAFDIDEIPFSRRGSWLDLSRVVGLHTRAEDLHLVSHQTGMHAVLRLQPEHHGRAIETEVSADPAVLEWAAPSGAVRATFDGPAAIRFAGDGLGMRFSAGDSLTPFTGGFLFTDPLDGGVVLTSYETGRRYRFTVLSGEARVIGDGDLGEGERAVVFADDHPWEVVVEEFETARPPYRSEHTFDRLVARSAAEFAAYSAALAPSSCAGETAAKAAYVLWSATVRPSGFVGREAILMSKHWMDKVWSWDHCFNALALAGTDPDAALDQFLLPFDHQDASGALPDSITHSEVLYNFVKPPIHGWAFRELEARAARPFTPAELAAVYERLAAWTRFWLDSRRAPAHALPYYQHGNDSGWDNSTTFDADRVIEAPDLAAFLILQLDVLAGLADRLGEASAPWSEARDDLAHALHDELWTGDRFVARAVDSGRPSSTSSLLNALPIVLGEQLPAEVAERLATRIADHLTEWGPATEPVDSPRYESDGYWRGPIWAPSTVLIESGLRRAGFEELADRVSAAFRAVCERSGFAENFDAVTGDGLRDRAYTWTASAYLVLLADARVRDTARLLTIGEQ
ncbi:glycogen debranching protein [Microbacterium sp. X-17]|uniref:amylo-alpha-1,6-glucosidase n=1 Tax=Microbacterium sp. X-17 TaxID=3144404 RepID=UPI0031F4F4A1